MSGSCKHCGAEEGFYTKGYARGKVITKYKFNEASKDDLDTFSNLKRSESSYTYCISCHQPLFKTKSLANRRGTAIRSKKKRFGIIAGILLAFILIGWGNFKANQGQIVFTNTYLYMDNMVNVVNVVNDYREGKIDSAYTGILLDRAIQNIESQKEIMVVQLKGFPKNVDNYWALLDNAIGEIQNIRTAIENDDSEDAIKDAMLNYGVKSQQFVNAGMKVVFYKDIDNETGLYEPTFEPNNY